MQQALIKFYYQFHTHQHYFLCHDILEDAWKEQANYSKSDAIVGLILFTTACYHYRRHNIKGAEKSFIKAKHILATTTDGDQLYLDLKQLQLLIDRLLYNIQENKVYQPVKLPIYAEFELIIRQQYTDYYFNHQIINDSYIINHHLERDRSEVIHNKALALAQRLRERQHKTHYTKD
ncbi:DUF309 domain-containing protein [Staphylococcus simiae]|uniref:DUF309 domain-containing protein n=1 Tax=Staphylococcus simiae CCM 7213 = CCUG 51256 TaxID=911238 RepID=G5JJF7_9STAP|nr:DUF309 domain-containing protein [Staphylococcus simiae]EHJ07682.1 hypothetical protein SS7213T_08062 [Staphylococcus simiae CCM 7213 = CCUG 51256]PNZ14196.1 DUF309 domain-containing protein [Staphylococcus simiae]SNV72314.1 Putative cytosolic protein [Staphylococcus simiae]